MDLPNRPYDAPPWSVVLMLVSLKWLIPVLATFFVGAWAWNSERYSPLLLPAGYLLCHAVGGLSVGCIIKGMWRRYYRTLGVPITVVDDSGNRHVVIPEHDTFPSWVGYIDRMAAWLGFLIGQPAILAGWLSFRVAVDLLKERAARVEPVEFAKVFQRSASTRLPEADSRMLRLMGRATTNIYLFGVGANLLVGIGAGLVSRVGLIAALCSGAPSFESLLLASAKQGVECPSETPAPTGSKVRAP